MVVIIVMVIVVIVCLGAVVGFNIDSVSLIYYIWVCVLVFVVIIIMVDILFLVYIIFVVIISIVIVVFVKIYYLVILIDIWAVIVSWRSIIIIGNKCVGEIVVIITIGVFGLDIVIGVIKYVFWEK